MSSGGGGTNTVTQTIPSWMQGYIGNTYNTAQNVANTGFTPYSGQQVAPLNSTQQTGLGQLGATGASQTGMGAINAGVNSAGASAGYSPQQLGFQAPTTAQIQQYMNPEVAQQESSQDALIQEQGNVSNQQTAGSATAAGAYGGARQGVQTALNNQYTGMTMANTNANIESNAYNTALGQTNTNNQLLQQAAEANQNAGLTANQQGITAGMVLGQLGGEQQANATGNAENVINSGSAAQSVQQQQDTAAYNQYMQQLMWPYQQLSALEGATYQGNAGGSTTSPLYSNTLGQVAGLGMAGLGMAGSMGWLGGGSAAAGSAAGAGAGDALAEGAMLLA
jgi:hypothetical protein